MHFGGISSSTLIWLLYFPKSSYLIDADAYVPENQLGTSNSSHSQPESVQLLYASELAKPSVNFLIVPGSNWALLCVVQLAVSHFELKIKPHKSWAWSHDKPCAALHRQEDIT